MHTLENTKTVCTTCRERAGSLPVLTSPTRLQNISELTCLLPPPVDTTVPRPSVEFPEGWSRKGLLQGA